MLTQSKTPYVVAAVVAVAIVAGAVVFGWRYLRQTPLPIESGIMNPASTKVTADKQESGNLEMATSTAGWKTYHNEEYGFEFRYPSMFVFTSATSSGPVELFMIWFSEPGRKQLQHSSGWAVGVYRLKYYPGINNLGQWVDSFAPVSTQDVQLGGARYVKWISSDGEPFESNLYSTLLDSNTVVSFSSAGTFGQSKEFTDIVSSFKFIK